MAQLPSSIQLNAVSFPGRRRGCRGGSWKGGDGAAGAGEGSAGRGGEGGRGRERTSVTRELSMAVVAFGSGQCPNADFFFLRGLRSC